MPTIVMLTVANAVSRFLFLCWRSWSPISFLPTPSFYLHLFGNKGLNNTIAINPIIAGDSDLKRPENKILLVSHREFVLEIYSVKRFFIQLFLVWLANVNTALDYGEIRHKTIKTSHDVWLKKMFWDYHPVSNLLIVATRRHKLNCSVPH